MMRCAPIARLAPKIKRYILVLDHMPIGAMHQHDDEQREKTERWKDALDLSPHGEDEEDKEVHDEDGPVHGDVERRGERAEERDERRAGC